MCTIKLSKKQCFTCIQSFYSFFVIVQGISKNMVFIKWASKFFEGKKIKLQETYRQCSQNVDVNGPHHRCFELIVSSSFNQPMAVERGRSHELVGSIVGAVYVHVLRTLRKSDALSPLMPIDGVGKLKRRGPKPGEALDVRPM